MKTLALALGLTLVATSATALAATHEHDMAQHQTVAKHAGVGVLKALNAKDGKVQIAHEPIAELGWPAMTMWFVLRAPAPQDLKIGDTVHFEMLQSNKKHWVIVKIGRK